MSVPTSISPPAARRAATPSPRRLGAAFAGILATAAALAGGELAAGLLSGVPSPLLAVGRMLIDFQPAGAKNVFVDRKSVV